MAAETLVSASFSFFFLFAGHIFFYDVFMRYEIGKKGNNRLGISPLGNGGTFAYFRCVPRKGNRSFKAYFFFKNVSYFHVGRQSGIAKKNSGKNLSERIEREI